jgi:hypothetical protein
MIALGAVKSPNIKTRRSSRNLGENHLRVAFRATRAFDGEKCKARRQKCMWHFGCPISILNHRDAGDRANFAILISWFRVQYWTLARIYFLSRRGFAWFCEPILLVFFDLRLIAQHRVQQRTMNFNFPVVTDEALFAKFIHEEAYARPCCAYHFCQSSLAKRDRNTLRAVLLAEICQKK